MAYGNTNNNWSVSQMKQSETEVKPTTGKGAPNEGGVRMRGMGCGAPNCAPVGQPSPFNVHSGGLCHTTPGDVCGVRVWFEEPSVIVLAFENEDAVDNFFFNLRAGLPTILAR